MDQVKFFKGSLAQILLGLFLNTLFHVLSEEYSDVDLLMHLRDVLRSVFRTRSKVYYDEASFCE